MRAVIEEIARGVIGVAVEAVIVGRGRWIVTSERGDKGRRPVLLRK